MTPPLQIDVRALQSRLFGSSKVPEAEQWRLYYGNSVSPERVESVIRAAQMGYMRDLTDLAYETVAIDPHLGSILGKRFRAIAALDYDVIAASGPGVEPEPASEVADMVRQAFARITNLPDAVQSVNWGHFDGRASVEKQWIYDPSDPIAWSITELSWMHPRRLAFGPEREIRVNDSAWGNHAFEKRGFDVRSVPYKWSTFTPRMFNDYPEREGLAPRCLYFSLFKRFSWRERMVLLEVFGRPWRILWVPDPSLGLVQDAQLNQAQESIDQMAANSTGVLPPGVALQTDQPHPESGQLHKDIAQEADDQNSLLVLGNKRTSDAKSGALGSSADDVAKNEQTEVTMADARDLSAFFTAIAREIVLLNLGPDALRYAPKISFITEAPPDRSKEIDRTAKAIEIGLPVKLSEVYEKCGFEQPQPGDDVIQVVTGRGTDALGNPTSTKAPKIGPMGDDGNIRAEESVAGVVRLELAPADVAKVVRVDEARASQGLPPSGDERGGLMIYELTETAAEPEVELEPTEAAPPTTTDPDGDGEPGEPPTDESAAQLAAKMTELQIARCEHGAINRCRLCGIERVRDVELVNGEPSWKLEWRAIPKPAQLSAPVRGTAARPFDGHVGHVCFARDPDSVFGSPDVLVERGVEKSTAAIAKWVHVLEKAVDGKTTAAEIRKAINGRKQLDLTEFAGIVEREVMRGVMLGALDSAWERENDEQVKLETFSRITMVATAPSFVSRPYDAALAFFRSKSILTRTAFDRLSAAAKKRAFTVARLASKELIGTVKSELDRMLELGKGAMIPGTHQGPDLGAFKQFMRERIESAGWTPANSSHVETIYRTNVMIAYGAGRKTEMTQPEVLKARPYWQIRGVRDDRQRENHAAARDIVLPADDPFWDRAYPPFGFNCRCRVISRSEAWVKRTGATIGPVPSDLPDEGWEGSGKL